MVGPETNPYQPSRVPEVRVPPRPPGKAAVFLWAVFALPFGSPMNLWFRFLYGLPERPSEGASTGLVFVPWVLGPLLAHATDRWPVFGSRREGYLLLGCILMVLAWAAAPFVPATVGPWLAIYVALQIGMLIASTTNYGGIVELARRHGTPGRFAAATVALGQAVLVLGPPVGVKLDRLPVGWTAALGAGLALSVIVGAVISEDSQGTNVEAEADRRQRPSFLRSRVFWAALTFGVAARLFGDAHQNPVLARLRPLHADVMPTSGQELLTNGAAIALCAAYAWTCRRVPAGVLLRAALAAQALAFLTWLLPDASDDAWYLLRSLADTAVMLALGTLFLRSAPTGQEALAYVLLISVSAGISGMATPPLMEWLGLGWSPTIAAAVLVSMLAALAVSALPRALAEGRDGEPQRVV